MEVNDRVLNNAEDIATMRALLLSIDVAIRHKEPIKFLADAFNDEAINTLADFVVSSLNKLLKQINDNGKGLEKC